MLDILINVFLIIGVVMSVIGLCVVLTFAYISVYDLLKDAYESFKFRQLKKSFKTEKKLYIQEQLEDLKKRYPDLEINYKMK